MDLIKDEIAVHWLNLEHLDLRNSNPNRYSGYPVDASLLAACVSPENRHGRLRSLVLAPHHATSVLSPVRTLHATTIVDLDVQGCNISGTGINMLSSLCPIYYRSWLGLRRLITHPRQGERGPSWMIRSFILAMWSSGETGSALVCSPFDFWSAVETCPVPRTVTIVQAFLGSFSNRSND